MTTLADVYAWFFDTPGATWDAFMALERLGSAVDLPARQQRALRARRARGDCGGGSSSGRREDSGLRSGCYE